MALRSLGHPASSAKGAGAHAGPHAAHPWRLSASGARAQYRRVAQLADGRERITGPGTVLRPEFASPVFNSLSFSVDYYDISIRDVISTAAGNTALAKCYNQDGSNPSYSVADTFCQLISRDNIGGIANVSLPYLNPGGLKTSGVDFQLDWAASLGSLGEGRFTLNSVVSYPGSYQIKNFATDAFQEFRGTIDAANALPLPRWRHLNAMRDVTAVIRPASPARGMPAYDLFDLTARVRVNDAYQFRFGVTNLFDKAPLVIAGTPGNTLPGT